MLKFNPLSIPSFGPIFTDLQNQFPPNELKTQAQFEAQLAQDDYHLLLVTDGQQPVAYLMILTDQSTQTIWLEYLAVYQSFHGSGYGQQILKELPAYFPDKRGAFLEIEKPDPKRINTIRRIDFYKRFGAKRLFIDYYYPNKDGALPMDLYFMPFNGQALPETPIVPVVKRILTRLHQASIPHLDDVLAKIH